jgi:hypothetical protein
LIRFIDLHLFLLYNFTKIYILCQIEFYFINFLDLFILSDFTINIKTLMEDTNRKLSLEISFQKAEKEIKYKNTK